MFPTTFEFSHVSPGHDRLKEASVVSEFTAGAAHAG
jgi:hypothetical protein